MQQEGRQVKQEQATAAATATSIKRATGRMINND